MLAEAPAPPPRWPAVAAPPSGEGFAQVLIAADVPARVALADGTVVCRETPCATTMGFGSYSLVFTGLKDDERTSQVRLDVEGQTVVLNHVLGRVHRSPARTFGEVLLLAGLTATATFLAVDSDVSPNLRNPLLALGGVGLGLSVVGGAITFASPVTMRGGSSTQWSPAAPAIAGLRLDSQF